MNPVGTKEKRKRLLETPPYELGPCEDYVALLPALMGLDIAEEMADAIALLESESITIPGGEAGRALRRWEAWKQD